MVWKRKSRVSTKQAIILLSLILVSIIPIVFRQDGVVSKRKSNRTITILTTHSDSTRYEFEQGFVSWWADTHGGEAIHFEWITPGSDNDVRRFLDTEFQQAREKTDNTASVGIGVDLFFGGNVHEFKHAKHNGYLDELSVFNDLVYVFAKDADGGTSVPQSWNGEEFYDEDHQWLGVCINRYGICYNTDSLERLGITEPPASWEDLTDPRYFGKIALADPSKSNSMTKAFEMILQQKMQQHITENPIPAPGEGPEQHRERILNQGWKNGMSLIQKITANTRYFSDSSTKIPLDVASGEAAVGICVDYYGRTYNSKYTKPDGSSRVQFIVPKNASTINVDPIAVLKNAPHPDLAQGFVKFCMLPKGQMLWNGVAGNTFVYGPSKTPLRRLPIRKDIYIEAYLELFTDPEDMPYEEDNPLIYDPSLTAPTFSAIQTIIRAMSVDTHDELTDTWASIIEAGVHNQPHEIMNRHFHDLNKVSYTKAINDIANSIERMESKVILNAQLDDMLRNDFNETVMKQYYPDAHADDYPELIQDLKTDVNVLKNIDMMYLENRQKRLADEFRGSYRKAKINAQKLN